MEELVELYVYDLSKRFNASSRKSSYSSGVAGIPRLYHTSIVAFGMEYTFNRDKGIQTIPLEEMVDRPYKTHVLGYTTRTMKQLDEFVEYLKKRDFQERTYELVQRNCQEFCIELCKFLGVQEELPEYVRKMPEFAKKNFGSENVLKGVVGALAGALAGVLAVGAGLGIILHRS